MGTSGSHGPGGSADGSGGGEGLPSWAHSPAKTTLRIYRPDPAASHSFTYSKFIGYATKSLHVSGTAGAGSGICNVGLDNTSKVLRNLSPSTNYEYKMKAFYCGPFGGSESIYSEVRQFTTKDDCPEITTLNVSTFNSNHSKASFSWDMTIGQELITNGNFATNSNWSGWQSISAGQLTKTGGGLAFQLGVVTSGKQYKIVVDVESLDGNTTVWLGGNNSIPLSVGLQTLYVTAGSTNNWFGINNGYSSGLGSVFNSVSVIEYAGAYVFARVALRVDTTGSSWQTVGGFGVYYPTLTANKFGLVSGQSYRAQGRTFCDMNVTSYRSDWTSPIFWTQPGILPSKIEGESASIENFDVYPNPSSDIFNISFVSEEVQDLNIRVVNMLGEVIHTESLEQFIGEYTKQVNLEDYTKGVYFLEIVTNQGVVNKKIVLQ